VAAFVYEKGTLSRDIVKGAIMSHLNTRRVFIPFPTDDEYAAALPADRDAAEILLACRAAGFPNAVITYPEHGLRRLLHAIQHDSDPTLTAQLDAVDAYTDEANKVLDALNERVPFAEPPAESCGIDWLDAGEPLDHVPADPSVMYQAGWVFNSRRAEIKAAYEKQLHKDYNALWTDRRPHDGR
jgi:hypothetical protein